MTKIITVSSDGLKFSLFSNKLYEIMGSETVTFIVIELYLFHIY